jgi:hypothetical protein
MSVKIVPEHLLVLMSKEDRKFLGKTGFTVQELKELHERDTERKIHDDIESYLRRNRIPYDHSRMDKKSTNKLGDPDFKVYVRNRVLFMEIKKPGGKLSEDQKTRIAELKAAGNEVYLCFSYDEARKRIEEFNQGEKL